MNQAVKLGAAALLCALAAAGCSASASSPARPAPATTSSGLRGDVLVRPEILDATAKSTPFVASSGTAQQGVSGGRTTLAAVQARHKLMLVYFGYTHCPDECPTTMADLGQALTGLPAAERSQVQVVFVTSDPKRDTVAVLKAWLSHFDAGLPSPFLGLAASVPRTDAIAASLGVPLSPPVTEPDGTVDVEHGTQVLAFIAGQAKLAWLAETSAADFAHDISVLLNTG